MSNELVNAPELAPPVGFAHAVVAAPGGRTVYLGGQTALGADGAIVGETLAEQFDVAPATSSPRSRRRRRARHVVSMLVFVTDVAEYQASLPELGEVWKRGFGRHYPALALLGVSALFDEAARIELVATAVVA